MMGHDQMSSQNLIQMSLNLSTITLKSFRNPITDTIKKVNGQTIDKTLDRTLLRGAQHRSRV